MSCPEPMCAGGSRCRPTFYTMRAPSSPARGCCHTRCRSLPLCRSRESALEQHKRMYSEDDIESAIKAGVLSEQTAAAFRAHAAQRSQVVVADEEQFRLVTGFNDIFVV